MLAKSLVARSGILALNSSPTLTSCPYSIVGTWPLGHDHSWCGVQVALYLTVPGHSLSQYAHAVLCGLSALILLMRLPLMPPTSLLFGIKQMAMLLQPRALHKPPTGIYSTMAAHLSAVANRRTLHQYMVIHHTVRLCKRLPPLSLPSWGLRSWAHKAGRCAWDITRRSHRHPSCSPSIPWPRRPHRCLIGVARARPGRPARPHGLLLLHIWLAWPGAMRRRPSCHLPRILCRSTCIPGLSIQ